MKNTKEKVLKELKEKIERLEDELLAYRRPRGTSVVNVREDERKKTFASVGKVIDKYKSVCLDERIMKELKQKLGIK